MLSLINLLRKNEIIISQNKGNNTRIYKRNLPMSKEWYNGLYNFNKNTSRTLPYIYNHTLKLLKWYFNMTNDYIEKNAQYKKVYNSYNHKLWISNPEIKHYNNKINITIYIYNNTYNYYKKKLELFQFTWGPILTHEKLMSVNKKKKLTKFRLFKRELASYIGTNKVINHKNHSYYQKIIRWLKLNKHIYMLQYKSNILNLIKKEDRVKFSEYLNIFKIKNYNYLINQYNKELLYLKLKQKILFNQFKYNEVYLSIIIELLQTIYKKKVEFNIVTLKYFWLNSSILLQILTAKIRNPKNRGKYLLPLNSSINKLKVPILSKNKLGGETKSYIGIQNIKLNEFNYTQENYLDKFLLINSAKSKVWSGNNIDGLVLSNLENKIIAGVFLKITGRLTKRYKAQRAIKKLRFKGTLKNVYSAHRNYSSSLSKGYNNINIEKSTINSKVRIGAFGLTGWIASY